MSIDVYQQIVKQVQQLTPDEQLKLMQELILLASYLHATYTRCNTVGNCYLPQADFFLTNDKQLSAITEIQVLILDNLIQKS